MRTSSLSPAPVVVVATTLVWCVTSLRYGQVTIRMPLLDFQSSMDLAISIQPFLWGAHVSSSAKSPDGTDDTTWNARSCSHDGKSGLWIGSNQSSARRVGSDRSSSRSLQNDSTSCSIGKHYRLINPSQGKQSSSAVQFTYQDRTVLTYVRVLSTVEEIEPTLKLKGLEEDALYSLEGTDKSLFQEPSSCMLA